MSKTRSIRFVVHYNVDRVVWTPGEWRMKARGPVPGMGKATLENLKNHVVLVEASTHSGGVNAHLGAAKVLSAKIIDQDSGETIVTYTA